MPNWYDDFNRADGPLGADWYDRGGNWLISNGHAHGSQNALEYRTGANETGDQDVSAGWETPVGQYAGVGLVLKAGGNTAYFYEVAFIAENNGVTCNIVEYGYPYQTTHATGFYSGSVGTLTTVRASYYSGVITGYVNGQQIAQWADSRYGGQGGWGLLQVASSTYLDWVMFGPPVARSINVTPDPIPAFGTEVRVTVTGTNTSWTPGVPGSSTVTCDYGTISEQVTMSVTSIQFWYDPADYIGPIVFTESEYGLTDTVNASADPEEFPDLFQCLLTPEGALLVNHTAELRTGTLLTTDTPIDTPLGEEDVTEVLSDLWRGIFGGEAPPPSPTPLYEGLDKVWSLVNNKNEPVIHENIPLTDTSLKEDAMAALGHLEGIRTEAGFSLYDVLLNLGGDPIASNRTIADRIGSPEVEPYHTLFAFLRSLMGDRPANLAHTEDEVIAVRGIGEWSLDDVIGDTSKDEWLYPYSIKEILDTLLDIRGDAAATVRQSQENALQAYNRAGTIITMLNNLERNGYTHLEDIVTAIRGTYPYTITNVFNQLISMMGTPEATIRDAVTETTVMGAQILDYLRGMNGTIVGPDSPAGFNLQELLELLIQVIMGNAVGVADILADLAAGRTRTWLEIVQTIIAGADFFVDLWDLLRGGATTVTTKGLPIYPGLGNVQQLTPVNFVDGITLDVPMDGAIIAISVPGEHPYAIKNTSPTRYGRLGTYSFASDVERLESIKPIQYLNTIATPHSIVYPTGLVIQCKPGTEGQVVPYLIPGHRPA